MGMRKYGDKEQGRVIPEDDDMPKTAGAQWSSDDEAALKDENADNDGDQA